MRTEMNEYEIPALDWQPIIEAAEALPKNTISIINQLKVNLKHGGVGEWLKPVHC